MISRYKSTPLRDSTAGLLDVGKRRTTLILTFNVCSFKRGSMFLYPYDCTYRVRQEFEILFILDHTLMSTIASCYLYHIVPFRARCKITAHLDTSKKPGKLSLQSHISNYPSPHFQRQSCFPAHSLPRADKCLRTCSILEVRSLSSADYWLRTYSPLHSKDPSSSDASPIPLSLRRCFMESFDDLVSISGRSSNSSFSSDASAIPLSLRWCFT